MTVRAVSYLPQDSDGALSGPENRGNGLSQVGRRQALGMNVQARDPTSEYIDRSYSQLLRDG